MVTGSNPAIQIIRDLFDICVEFTYYIDKLTKLFQTGPVWIFLVYMLYSWWLQRRCWVFFFVVEVLQRLVDFHLSQNPTCNSFASVLDCSVKGSAISKLLDLPPTHVSDVYPLTTTHMFTLPRFKFSIRKSFGCWCVSIEIRSKSVHGQFPPCAREAKQRECSL